MRLEDLTPQLLDRFKKETPEIKWMHVADKYYAGENIDIKGRRKMMVLYNDDGEGYLRPDYSKANNKIAHNYLYELVSQCTNYLVSRPMKLDYKTPVMLEHRETLDKILYNDNDFVGFLQDRIDDIQLYGKTYMRVVLNEGDFKLVGYNAKEMRMFYDDFDEPTLALRYFSKEELNDKGEFVENNYIEAFDKNRKWTYKSGKNGWELDKKEYVYSTDIKYGDKVVKNVPVETHLFPIIEWNIKKPTIVNIKDLIDLQDTNLSDLANNVEDIQEAIWILENYQGQNLADFMEDLKVKKAIKVGAGGSAKSHTVEIPVEARTKMYAIVEKNIYKFGFGIDFADRMNIGNVTGVALKWSYAPLEQKSNEIENRGREPLNNLFNIIFNLLGIDYDSNDLEFLFNRTLIINESEETKTAMLAASEVSKKTLLDNIPMVKDTEEELLRLEGEELNSYVIRGIAEEEDRHITDDDVSE